VESVFTLIDGSPFCWLVSTYGVTGVIANGLTERAFVVAFPM